MRKLTPITDDPISFINSVINRTKKRKDDDNYDEGHYQNFYKFPIKLLNYLVIIYFAP